MREFGGIAALITCIALVIVGVLVGWSARRNKYSHGGGFFVLLCLALAMWIGANTISDIDINNAKFWIQISFSSVTIALFSFLMFVNRFPVPRYISFRETLINTLLLFVLIPVIFSPLFIPEITINNNISSVVPGSLYPLFVVYLLYALGLATARLTFIGQKLKALQKLQIKYIKIGVGLMAGVAIMTNLLLPLILGHNNLYWVGSSATLLFIGSTAYSISRHGLFDIRRAIVRALAYLMTIVSLTIIYGFVLIVVVTQFINLEAISFNVQIFLIILAVAIGFTIPPLQKFFNNVTRHIFFRNLYDSQAILTELGLLAETEVEIKNFAQKALTLLNSALRPETIILAVKNQRNHISIFSYNDQTLDRETIEKIIDYKPPIIDGALKDDSTQRLGGQAEIGYSVSLDASNRRVGCLVVGFKKNGNNYSIEDKEFLGLFADELGLALQNLLRFEEIQAFNQTLKQKINDATIELKNNNLKLKNLDEAKDEFISMASHQLRTPLTSVKGYISMVLDGDAGSLKPAQRKLLEEAFISSQRMVYLIGDFLNVSRLETGKFILEKNRFDLAKLVQDEIEQMEASTKDKHIKIEFDPPKNFPLVTADENKLRQVIMNFLDNAVFYSPDSSSVEVQLAHTPAHVVLKIKDHGIGVPGPEQHKLFTKFFRATNARKHRPDGTGIGLFMAKKVIVAHEGAVIFESRENEGSTFGFQLPTS